MTYLTCKTKISMKIRKRKDVIHMIKAVIFDMDGVLIDTEKYLNLFWKQAAKEHGFCLQQEHALMIRSLDKKFAAPKLRELYGESFPYEEIRNRRRELMEEHLQKNGIEKKPAVSALLIYLKEHGYKTAVATATDLERTKKYLSEIEILDYFDKIICAPMVENGKPMPDIYLSACHQIGEEPQECLAVEDSPNGILAAFRAGCQVVMVPDLTQPEAEIIPLLYGKADTLKGIIALLENRVIEREVK